MDALFGYGLFTIVFVVLSYCCFHDVAEYNWLFSNSCGTKAFRAFTKIQAVVSGIFIAIATLFCLWGFITTLIGMF